MAATPSGLGDTSSGHAARVAFVRGIVAAPDWTLSSADIYVVRGDGTSLLNLTADDPAEDLAPAWSPTGRRLAFVRVEGLGQDASYAIWVMNADGSGRRLLTASLGRSPEEECQFEVCGARVSPTWSPDAKRIAFSRWDRSGRLHIWTMRAADGRQQRQLTKGRMNDVAPAWSPDGQSISFFRNDPSLRRQAAIWVFRVKTRKARRLLGTGTAGCALCPEESQSAWAPNARALVFAKAIGATTGGVIRLNVRTSRTLRLVAGLEPNWSSDGTSIAYAAPGSTDGRFAIHRLDLRSRTSAALTAPEYPFDDEYPAWQP